METWIVERSIWINAPREKVWQAITSTEGLGQWWGQDEWEIVSLELGGTIRFGSPSLTEVMVASISVLEPPRQFSIQWPPQPQYYNIAMETTFILTEENGGTQVTVRETGLETLPSDIRQNTFDATQSGYKKVLAALKAYVEGAEVM